MEDPFAEHSLKASLKDRMFGRLVENRWRGDLVEEIVARALASSEWQHCSGDWSSWDLQHPAQGLKMQVKQSARKQTWGITAQCRYGIAPAKGFYEGNAWKELPLVQRLSEVYVFAHHPIEDDGANHWDAQQWQFIVVRESELPNSKSIQHAQLLRWPKVGIADLADRVGSVCDGLAPNGRSAKAVVRKAGPTADVVGDLIL